MGKSKPIFPVQCRYPKNCLYDQEGYHRQVRKVTKNKGVFPNDDALYKLVYLAYRNIRRKWDHADTELGTHGSAIGYKI